MTSYDKGDHISACHVVAGSGDNVFVVYLGKGQRKSKEELKEEKDYPESDCRRWRPNGTPRGTGLIMTEKGYMSTAAWIETCHAIGKTTLLPPYSLRFISKKIL